VNSLTSRRRWSSTRRLLQGKLEAPKHLARTVHDLYFEPKYEEFVLVAQYESWKLPMAIVLIVPMCLLASVSGLLARGLPIDILAQIGFVVLVGLAAKNAILIVEFARQKEDAGAASGEAAVHAARTRLRPILMTSFAFILGVAPLAVARMCSRLPQGCCPSTW